jgi:hypothetical protein
MKGIYIYGIEKDYFIFLLIFCLSKVLELYPIKLGM